MPGHPNVCARSLNTHTRARAHSLVHTGRAHSNDAPNTAQTLDSTDGAVAENMEEYGRASALLGRQPQAHRGGGGGGGGGSYAATARPALMDHSSAGGGGGSGGGGGGGGTLVHRGAAGGVEDNLGLD